MRLPTLIVIAVVFLVLGCQSVHTTTGTSIPIAMWIDLPLADSAGNQVGSSERDLLIRVLQEASLHPTVNPQGISVRQGEEQRAREVLLTDHRLVHTKISVILAIPAGTARRTTSGFEIQVPPNTTTQPTK